MRRALSISIVALLAATNLAAQNGWRDPARHDVRVVDLRGPATTHS